LTSPSWSGLTKTAELITADGSTALKKVDGIIASVMEAIADALPTASASVLREGSRAAKSALETLNQKTDVDENSPSFVAGRLAAAVDVLGYAAHQTADTAILELARMQPYARILAALAKGAMRNVDLAKQIAKDEQRTSKWLTELREHGAVTSHKRGREMFNALTPVGRLVVEQGWQDARRAPLEDSEVYKLGGKRFDLSKRPAATDAQPSILPRISAADAKAA